MKIFTPLRVVTFVAALFAALSLGLGVAVAASSDHGNDDGVLGVFNGDQGTKACVHSRPLLERNERNVINYYRIAFNDKNPQLAVKLYGGAEYIQHNPLAANGFDAFIQFVTSFTTAFPDTHVDIRRVFADCDFVITHSKFTGAVPAWGRWAARALTSSASMPTARSSSTGMSSRSCPRPRRTATPRSDFPGVKES